MEGSTEDESQNIMKKQDKGIGTRKVRPKTLVLEEIERNEGRMREEKKG